MEFKLLTPEKTLVYENKIERLSLPAQGGDLTILPGHTFLITSLEAGVIQWKVKDKNIEPFFIWGGIADIKPDSVNLLTSHACVLSQLNSDNLESDLEGLLAQINSNEETHLHKDVALIQAKISSLKAHIDKMSSV